jgi:hypothetical protein
LLIGALMRRTRRDDERGLVLVLVALLLIVIMEVAAFAIDIGSQQTEHRQDRTAADAGALAGAQQLPKGLLSAAQAAMDTVRKNLPTVYTDAAYTALWQGCTDAGRPANFPNVSTASPCISANTSKTQLRVTLPWQITKTQFAEVNGVKQLKSSATAVAQISGPAGTGLLPFVVNSIGPNSGFQVCLKTPSGGQVISGSICDPLSGQPGSTQGNYGYIAEPITGNPALGTDVAPWPTCNGGQNNAIDNNMAVATDHIVRIYNPADGTIGDACTVSSDPTSVPFGPNYLFTQTGNTNNSNFDLGMVSDNASGCNADCPYSDGGPARLQRDDQYFPHTTVAGSSLDNQPLWDFIPASVQNSTTVPSSCWPSAFNNGVPHQTQMTSCFSDFALGIGCSSIPCPGPLFSAASIAPNKGMYDLEFSSRFGYVPDSLENLLLPGNCNGNGCSFHIQSFRPIYIQTLFYGNASNDTFDPGEPVGSGIGKNATAQGCSAWVFVPSMLPSKLTTNQPFGGQPDLQLSLVG